MLLEDAYGLFYNLPAGIFGADACGSEMRFAGIAAAIFLGMSIALAAAQGGAASSTGKTQNKNHSRDWPIYGGTPENNHFSSLTQINRKNVKRLRIAWTYDTEESGGLQTSPIVVDGVLYGLTPSQKVFALNAATGKLLWRFDSGIAGTQPDRGLAYWCDGAGKGKDKDCRNLVGVMNFLYALDAATGKPIPGFGRDGRIDLRENLGREPAAAQFPDRGVFDEWHVTLRGR